jgi:hypothetical protein
MLIPISGKQLTYGNLIMGDQSTVTTGNLSGIPFQVPDLNLIFKGDQGWCCSILFCIFNPYILLLHWRCFEYSDCYFLLFFVTVILQLSYTNKLCYLSYRIKEWFITLIRYNCFFIRVCFTFCNNVKMTFLTFGEKFS